MERRQMLHYLMAGGLTFGVGAPLFAQQGQGQPRPTTRPVSAPAQNAQPGGDAPALTPQEQQELDRVLREWEEKTKIITKLRGTHYRYEYDSVFLVEKRATGLFWYESPDKGRIDFNVKDEPPLTNPKPGPNGQSYQVQAESPSIWSCDGANIWQLNITDKTYDQIQIPLHARGENIMDGPLPFLFGMKAEKAKARYIMRLGSNHSSKDRDGRVIYHIVAKPKLPEDASNWSQAEAMLDAQYCLPKAIRLLDPAGTTETVYVFPLGEMKANEKRWIWSRDPFKPDLDGFRLLHSGVKEPEEHKRTGGILPVRGTD